jgi:two-component system, cell cycle sensor histidine kinase and response regulator CckA
LAGVKVKSGPESLAVLLLEDNPVDAELVIRKLKSIDLHAVVDAAKSVSEFQERLQQKTYDIILGDYQIPGWTGLDALKWLRSSGNNTPFILVTGTLGDELAIECLKSGVNDYVLKDNLERLPVAIRRTLAEQALREERDHAEDELRKSEEQYRLLFQANPHPMWVFEVASLHFLAVNEAALHHYGYSLSEFLDITIMEIRPAQDIPRFMESLQSRQQSGVGFYSEPWKHRKKDGTIIDVEISAHPITFQAREAKLVMVNDVTERKKLEEQFLQAQKMEAIGRLAGGMAHDFNNLLMIIGSYAHLTHSALSDEEKSGHYLNQISSAVKKATLLTQQLLSFSRKHIQDLRTIDLNGLVADFCKMLPNLLGEDVQLKVITSPEECMIYCDKGLIEQVIMNLVVNARDALPDGGSITLASQRVRMDASNLHETAGMEPGEYVLLKVTDTGTGMDEVTQSKMFEPFFTTKEVGKGTGLGLSTVAAIIKQCQGYIFPFSELGKGTTFKIYFPYVKNQAEVIAPAPEIDDQPSGKETILLVEDEQALRMVTAEFLGLKGYHVLTAEDTDHALQIAQTYEGKIDLLLTDLIMPRRSGAHLARAIARHRPNIAVIYMSGFAESNVKQDLEPLSILLQKPFSLMALAATIRKVLDRKNIEC